MLNKFSLTFIRCLMHKKIFTFFSYTKLQLKYTYFVKYFFSFLRSCVRIFVENICSLIRRDIPGGKTFVLYIKYFCSVGLFNGYVYATTCCGSESHEFLLHFSEYVWSVMNIDIS